MLWYVAKRAVSSFLLVIGKRDSPSSITSLRLPRVGNRGLGTGLFSGMEIKKNPLTEGLVFIVVLMEIVTS